MKKILLLALLCIASANIKAEFVHPNNITEYDKDGQKTQETVFTKNPDGTTTSITQRLFPSGEFLPMNQSTYDERGARTASITYYRDMMGELIQPTKKDEFSFNEDRRLTYESQQLLLNNEWRYLIITKREYHPDGNIKAFEQLRWRYNGTNNSLQFEHGSRETNVITYHPNTNKVNIRTLTFYNVLSEPADLNSIDWGTAKVTESEYDVRGNQIAQKTDEANTYTVYDERNRPIERITINNNTNEQMKFVTGYAHNGTVTLNETYRMQNGWVGVRRERGYVDSFGRFALIERGTWDHTKNDWANVIAFEPGYYDNETRFIEEHDEKGNRTLAESYVWEAAMNRWSCVMSNKTKYNEWGTTIYSHNSELDKNPASPTFSQLIATSVIRREFDNNKRLMLYVVDNHPSKGASMNEQRIFDPSTNLLSSITTRNFIRDNEPNTLVIRHQEFAYQTYNDSLVLHRINKFTNVDFSETLVPDGYEEHLFSVSARDNSLVTNGGARINVYSESGSIMVNDLNQGDLIQLFSIDGRLIDQRTGSASSELFQVQQGNYIVKVNKNSAKVVVQ